MMILTRRALRHYYVLYGFLSVLFLAMLVWWIYYQVRESARMTRQQEQVWRQEIKTAQHWHDEHSNGGAEFRRWLSANFPDLEYDYQKRILVSKSARTDLKNRADRRMRMFISEGAFMILLMIAGVTYIFWTLRRELQFEQRQSTFLSATSHELKTPITSLRLYLDTLRERQLPPEKQAQVFETMQQDMERLTDLIERLLQAQAVVGRSRHAKLEEINLSEETKAAIEQDRDFLERKGFRLNCELASNLAVLADAKQWHLVVKNLVENAAKYSGNSREIQVRLTARDSRARLEVQDFGMGIEPDELDRIFEKFYRIGSEDRRASGGTGLGLYLVRAIARGFRGKAWATSSGPGKGATFIVELPLKV